MERIYLCNSATKQWYNASPRFSPNPYKYGIKEVKRAICDNVNGRSPIDPFKGAMVTEVGVLTPTSAKSPYGGKNSWRSRVILFGVKPGERDGAYLTPKKGLRWVPMSQSDWGVGIPTLLSESSSQIKFGTKIIRSKKGRVKPSRGRKEKHEEVVYAILV